MEPYPGTERHRRALEAVSEHYRADERVLAVVVFGSLARGNWDEYSDLDLDVVLEDGVALDLDAELRGLGDALAAIDERVAVVVPHRPESGDLVCVSRLGLSIRYHPLATTSPNIIESMRLLCGSISLEVIRAAGLARWQAATWDAGEMAGQCVRSLVEADRALRREWLWFAVEMLTRVRDTLIELYGYSRGAPRLLRYFQTEAAPDLQRSLGALLTRLDASELREALEAGVRLLETELPRISNGSAALTTAQRELLRGLVERA